MGWVSIKLTNLKENIRKNKDWSKNSSFKKLIETKRGKIKSGNKYRYQKNVLMNELNDFLSITEN